MVVNFFLLIIGKGFGCRTECTSALGPNLEALYFDSHKKKHLRRKYHSFISQPFQTESTICSSHRCSLVLYRIKAGARVHGIFKMVHFCASIPRMIWAASVLKIIIFCDVLSALIIQYFLLDQLTIPFVDESEYVGT